MVRSVIAFQKEKKIHEKWISIAFRILQKVKGKMVSIINTYKIEFVLNAWVFFLYAFVRESKSKGKR